MRIDAVKVFKYDELSEAAKEKAREWYLGDGPDWDWWDSVYETFTTALKLIGADCELRQSKRRDGSTIWTPAIFFSGFWSQGGGACFECNYSFKAGAVKALKAEFGGELGKELAAIAKRINKAQRKVFYSAECQIRHRGHYNHENTMHIDMDCRETSQDVFSEVESDLLECFRDIARLIYKSLRQEYDYLTSKETIEESIRANEYEFAESGKFYS